MRVAAEQDGRFVKYSPLYHCKTESEGKALAENFPAARAVFAEVDEALGEKLSDIIFGGHTHGGQVRIQFSRSALVANCDIPRDQARGLSTWTHDGRTVPLNVSAGLGHSIYAPVRFACRPEVSVLEIRATSPVDSA